MAVSAPFHAMTMTEDPMQLWTALGLEFVTACLVQHLPDEPVVCRNFAMLSGRVVIIVFTGAITFLQVMLNVLGCQLTY